MKTSVRRQRSGRKAQLWQKKLERYRTIQRQIERSAPDILQSRNFRRTKEYLQHGNMTVNSHVMNVARYSIALSDMLHICCNRRELIRGALLHDYFLYDWHKNKIRPSRFYKFYELHGFTHPGTALKNAKKDFRLTKREQDIIKKHMWPLTVIPPMCREAWIVTAADKYCSLMETLHLHGKKTKK